MKVLIVEDQPDKKESIEKFLYQNYGDINVFSCNSLRGAIKHLVLDSNYDFILLDMSMPAFDISDSYLDESPESYAGRELMEHMKLRGIFVPIIIVTQYSSFEGGAVTLEGLSNYFQEQYKSFYFGFVYYSSGNDDWKLALNEKILNIKRVG